MKKEYKHEHTLIMDDKKYIKTAKEIVDEKTYNKEWKKTHKISYKDFIKRETDFMMDRDSVIEFYTSYIVDKLKGQEIVNYTDKSEANKAVADIKAFVVKNPLSSALILDLIQIGADRSIKVFRIDESLLKIASQIHIKANKIDLPTIHSLAEEPEDKLLYRAIDFLKDRLSFSYKVEQGKSEDDVKISNIRLQGFGHVYSVDVLGEAEDFFIIKTINFDSSYILQTYVILYDGKDNTFVDVNSMFLSNSTLKTLSELHTKIEKAKVLAKEKELKNATTN